MRAIRLLMLTAAFAPAACNRSDSGSKQPEGQVVAEVAGEEITTRELNMELRGAAISDPEILKAAQRAALAAIINRKLLAKAARDQGLDKSADYQLSKRRSDELLLAQEMQSQAAKKIARPTREEAARYMAAHPNNFAQRKIYTVDQIQFSLAGKRDKLKEFASLKSLDDVEQKLLADGIDYRKAPASIDGQMVPPQLIDQIAKVPPGEVFLIPNGQMVVANQIKDTRVVPFTGEDAIAQAQQLLLRERLGKALEQQAEELRKKAGKVNYKQGYGPPPANAPKLNPTRGEGDGAGAVGAASGG